jgi:hypothetical protein
LKKCTQMHLIDGHCCLSLSLSLSVLSLLSSDSNEFSTGCFRSVTNRTTSDNVIDDGFIVE